MQTSAFKSFSAQELPKKEVDLNPHDFQAWHTQHHYRTHYRDMTKKAPAPPKKYAIPGYAGYIPSSMVDNNYGKTFTQTSKEQLNRNKYLPERLTDSFPQRPFTSETMGKTLGKFGGGLEDEYHTISRFHGKCTIPMSHPNYTNTSWETSYAAVHVPQEPQRTRIFRTTDMSAWKAVEPCPRPRAQSSGFVGNSTLFDGHGWVPMRHLHGDMKPTEYRNRFNMYMPFHPRPLKPNARKMRKREKVY